MASETTPELEALVLGLFEVGAVKVRASLSLRVHTCMLATGRADGAGICLGAQTQFGELEAQERRSAVCTLN